jgi:hypothetical protein
VALFLMLSRTDMYKLVLTANADAGGEYDVAIKYEMTLAGLQDMIGSIIEATPQASSFVITVVRVTHTQETTVN